MKLIFGILILIMWCAVATLMGWDNKRSRVHNIFIGLVTVLIIGVIYWVPFWLIFMR